MKAEKMEKDQDAVEAYSDNSQKRDGLGKKDRSKSALERVSSRARSLFKWSTPHEEMDFDKIH